VRRERNKCQAEIPCARVFHCCTPVDRTGLAAYTVMIRAPDDPERTLRSWDNDKTPHLTNAKTSPEEWAEKILVQVRDGRPRTILRDPRPASDVADLCSG